MQTNGRTDGRYQTYYLPCFAIDKNQGHRSNGSALRVFTDTHTDTRKDGSDSMTSTVDVGGNNSSYSLVILELF